MNFRELGSGFFLSGLGILFCGGGMAIGIGTLAIPEEGFLPFLSGGTLLLLSLVFILQRLFWKRPDKQAEPFWPEKKSILRVGCVLVSLLVYTAVFEWMGFALATFILFLFLLKTIDPMEWKGAIGLSFLVTVIGFVLFQVWLQVQLPEGWISWWGISRWIF